MTAGPPQARHFTSGPSRDDGPDLDLVVGAELLVTGNERPVADDQVGLARQPQLGKQGVDAPRPGDVELAPGIAQQHLHSVQSAGRCAACYPRRRARRARRLVGSRALTLTDWPGSSCST